MAPEVPALPTPPPFYKYYLEIGKDRTEMVRGDRNLRSLSIYVGAFNLRMNSSFLTQTNYSPQF